MFRYILLSIIFGFFTFFIICLWHVNWFSAHFPLLIRINQSLTEFWFNELCFWFVMNHLFQWKSETVFFFSIHFRRDSCRMQIFGSMSILIGCSFPFFFPQHYNLFIIPQFYSEIILMCLWTNQGNHCNRKRHNYIASRERIWWRFGIVDARLWSRKNRAILMIYLSCEWFPHPLLGSILHLLLFLTD